MQLTTQPGTFPYAPCYCEENIWHLAGDPSLGDGRRWVLFISNPEKSCAFWCHRAAEVDGTPVLWDYHVVLLVESANGPQVFDLDSTAGLPLSLSAYLTVTFPFGDQAPGGAPRFAVVEAEQFRQRFASDRSHMRDEEGWFVPPPDWPQIGGTLETNLSHFVDMDAAWVEECFDLEGLRARFSSPANRDTRD